MTREERLKQMQSLRDCMKYLLVDASKADLPLVSLHLKIAIAEADTLIEEEAGKEPVSGQECRSA